ncbi:MAG: DMT family transporter [Chloroflexota bacterium]
MSTPASSCRARRRARHQARHQAAPPPIPDPGGLRGHRAAEIGVLLVVVAWAANFIVVKAANREIPPIAFAYLRFTLAAVLLLAVLRWREGSIRMPLRDAMPIMGLGAIGFGLYQILWPTALQTIPAGDSAFLIASTPVFTALFASIAGSDTLTRRKIAGALISFVGVGIVVAGGPGLVLGTSLVGDGLTLLAAICWAVYTAWGAPVLARHSPLRTTTLAMVGGSLTLAPIGLIQAAGTDWGAVSVGAWAGFAYSALIPAGIANVVVFNAIKLLGPTRITGLQFLVPFVAVILGAMFLNEAIQPAQIAGGAVIIVGVAIARALRVPGVRGRFTIRGLT